MRLKVLILVKFKVLSFVALLLTITTAYPQFYQNNPFLNNAFGYGQNIQNFQPNPSNLPNYQQFPQSSFYFPSNPSISNRNPLNQQPNTYLRISETKCNEYYEKSRPSVAVSSLSLFPSIQNIQDDNCDSSLGLIIGGEKAKSAEFPHMAALGFKNLENLFTFICGGSLISDQFVLTAAHCRRGGRDKPTLVRLGALNIKDEDQSSKKLDVRIAVFIVHENYDPNRSKNDIAVIKLTRTVEFSRYIRPACLMNPNQRVHNNKAIATGWGLTNAFYGDSSEVLQKVELSVISNQECRKILDDQDIDDTQLCAGDKEGGKDTCRGDSGGPLQIVSEKNKCLYIIIGITSYGNAFCGSENSPGVYTRVSEYIDWIEQKVWGVA